MSGWKRTVPDKTVYIRHSIRSSLDFRPNWGEWSAAREAELEPAFLGQMPVRDIPQECCSSCTGDPGRYVEYGGGLPPLLSKE